MNTIENLNFMIKQAYLHKEMDRDNAYTLDISITDNRYEIEVTDFTGMHSMNYQGIARDLESASKTAINFFRNKIKLDYEDMKEINKQIALSLK